MYTCTCKSFIHMSYWKKNNIIVYILYTWMQAINCLIVSVGSNGLQHYSSVPIQDAVVLLEPRKVSMARMKSMKDTSLFPWRKWGLSPKGKPGERSLWETCGGHRVLCFFVSCLIDFNMIQSPQLRTAIFFIIMAMLRNGFVDAIKPNRQKF